MPFSERRTFAVQSNFGGADIGGTFTLSGTRFINSKQEANFNGLNVGQSLALKQAVFAGPVDFTGARVGGEFNAARARFESPSGKAIFNGIKISQNTSFLNADLRRASGFERRRYRRRILRRWRPV